MQNTFTDVITSVVAALVAGLGGLAVQQIKSFVSGFKNKQLLQAIVTLADNAVVVAEKAGVMNKLSNDEKVQTAIKSVQDGLNQAGFKSADEQLIANAIEKAYMNAQQELHAVYAPQQQAQATEQHADLVAQANQDVADKQQALIQAQQDLADAQTQQQAVVQLAPEQ